MENNFKHTPGPWTPFDGDYVCVNRNAAKMICDIRGWGWLQKKGEKAAIAEQIANAKLIAAAPDLLEALLEAQAMMEQWIVYRRLNGLSGGNAILEHAIEQGTAAIKKATA